MYLPVNIHAIGSKTQGTWGAVKGFGAGLGVGVVGGLGMMVGGAVTGVTQIGRGIINTPSSIAARYIAMPLIDEWIDEWMDGWMDGWMDPVKFQLWISLHA